MKLQDLQKSLKSITSKEIETITSKRHDHILRDIDSLNKTYENIGLPKVGEGTYLHKNTGKQEHRMFILTKMQCLDLMTGYNHELRIAVNRRWEQLELQLQSEQQRLHQRNEARLGCPKMTDALQVQRLEEGKLTKPHHFSNEHNMVYRIVLGVTAKKFKEAQDIEGNLRDALTPLQIEAVTKIQDMNTTLIDLGISYKDRKGTLDAFYEKRFSALLLKEFIELNA